MQLEILDAFDIGEDRSVLLIKVESQHLQITGVYKLVVDNNIEDTIIIDGVASYSKSEEQDKIFVTTTKRVSLKKMLDLKTACFLQKEC